MKHLKRIKPINLLMLTLAGIINAFGVTLFLAPVKLYDSGISGTSMLLAKVTPEFFTLSIFLLIYYIIYGRKLDMRKQILGSKLQMEALVKTVFRLFLSS